jgi:hypothetical protein
MTATRISLLSAPLSVLTDLAAALAPPVALAATLAAALPAGALAAALLAAGLGAAVAAGELATALPAGGGALAAPPQAASVAATSTNMDRNGRRACIVVPPYGGILPGPRRLPATVKTNSNVSFRNVKTRLMD